MEYVMSINTPISELEAVNFMLQEIGEQPVNSIPDTGISDASIAISTLQRVSNEVQTWGLHSNTERNFPLIPDTEGNINVPLNTLGFDAEDYNRDLVLRGTRVYDKENHTYKFDKEIKATLVLFLPFDELPSHVRNYIVVSAARRFQEDVLGSSVLSTLSEKDENMAYLNFRRQEMKQNDVAMINSPSVYRTVGRQGIVINRRS
jgi:hypothetical protein